MITSSVPSHTNGIVNVLNDINLLEYKGIAQQVAGVNQGIECGILNTVLESSNNAQMLSISGGLAAGFGAGAFTRWFGVAEAAMGAGNGVSSGLNITGAAETTTGLNKIDQEYQSEIGELEGQTGAQNGNSFVASGLDDGVARPGVNPPANLQPGINQPPVAHAPDANPAHAAPAPAPAVLPNAAPAQPVVNQPIAGAADRGVVNADAVGGDTARASPPKPAKTRRQIVSEKDHKTEVKKSENNKSTHTATLVQNLTQVGQLGAQNFQAGSQNEQTKGQVLDKNYSAATTTAGSANETLRSILQLNIYAQNQRA